MRQITIFNKKIVILAGPGDSTNILFHTLDQAFGVHRVIIEEPISQKQLLKRRVEKLGWTTVFGQILFKLLIAKPMERFSQKRLRAIRIKNQLDNSSIPEDIISHVFSINSPDCLVELQRLQPDIIVVNGTRIIGKKVLTNMSCRFINTHAGITPLYRGVHGGYWALANGDHAHCGVTIHLVDSGIDTGGIIAQEVIHPTPEDNFATYPLLQLAAGLPLLIKAVQDILQGYINVVPAPQGESRLWSHPTLMEYLRARSRNNVR